ncbi:MAG: HNH endonuclease [Saprospiraceae bacterium]|nr:HNH endonuclease [Saprospiraceae bacterium]
MEEQASARLSRPLLLLDAYLHDEQVELVPSTFDIEHIFPKKWQDTNYNGWEEKDAETYLDRFGNKIVFEKKLNIQAGNGYFGKKKDRYSSSKIAVVLELSNYSKSDWLKEDIENVNTSLSREFLIF